MQRSRYCVGLDQQCQDLLYSAGIAINMAPLESVVVDWPEEPAHQMGTFPIRFC